MKNWGILLLVAGLVLGMYSINMDVSISVPARDYGHGIETPAMQVANLDKMSQRQSFMIFSGILSVVGAILLGFGSMQTRRQAPTYDDAALLASVDDGAIVTGAPPSASNASGRFSICPKCRHMGSGDDVTCTRCGAALPA